MLKRSLAVVAAALALAAPGSTQEPELPEVFQQPEEDLHAEMIELVREIERTLRRLDVELFDAGAGEAPLESVGDSGVDQLLRSSREKMQSVVDAIDRIFEIRDHHQAAGGT